MRTLSQLIGGLVLFGAGAVLTHMLWPRPTPDPPPTSEAATLARLDQVTEALGALQVAQGALYDDVEALYDEARPVEAAPAALPDEAEVAQAARDEQERISVQLAQAPSDAQAEEALKTWLATTEIRGQALDLREVRCSDRLCRLEIGTSPEDPGPDPVSLLMGCPALGGELILAPSAADPTVLVAVVGRDGAALSG